MSESKFVTLGKDDKKKVDWSEPEDQEDDEVNVNVWEKVPVSGDVPKMEEILKQQEKDDKQNWPENENETKKPRENTYQRKTEYPPRQKRERNTTVPNEPPYTARVSNLNFRVTEDELREFFEELGVSKLNLVYERDNPNKSRGYAFIEFETREGLQNALLAHETEFMDRKMDVSVHIRENRSFGRNDNFYNKKRYDYGERNRGRESYSSQTDEPKERRKLNLAPRTLPLEDRHRDPGSENREGPIKENTEQEIEEPKRENPFGQAKPIQTKYYDRREKDNREEPRREKQERNGGEERPYKKNFNQNRKYNNNNNNRRQYQKNEEKPPRNDGWTTRGGKARPSRGGRGGNTGTGFSTRNQDQQQQQQSTLKTENKFELLSDPNDEENEN